MAIPEEWAELEPSHPKRKAYEVKKNLLEEAQKKIPSTPALTSKDEDYYYFCFCPGEIKAVTDQQIYLTISQPWINNCLTSETSRSLTAKTELVRELLIKSDSVEQLTDLKQYLTTTEVVLGFPGKNWQPASPEEKLNWLEKLATTSPLSEETKEKLILEVEELKRSGLETNSNFSNLVTIDYPWQLMITFSARNKPHYWLTNTYFRGSETEEGKLENAAPLITIKEEEILNQIWNKKEQGESYLTGDWKTSEQLFQACKYAGKPEIIAEIRNYTGSLEAIHRIDKKYEQEIRSDWGWKKQDRVMLWVVRRKIARNAGLLKSLRLTGYRQLVENSPFDSYWGVGKDGRGENKLGKIWVGLRSQIRVEYCTTENQRRDVGKRVKIDEGGLWIHLNNWIKWRFYSQPFAIREKELKNLELHLITQIILSQLTPSEFTLNAWKEGIRRIKQSYSSEKTLLTLLDRNFFHHQFSTLSLDYLKDQNVLYRLKKLIEHLDSPDFLNETRADIEKLTAKIDGFENFLHYHSDYDETLVFLKKALEKINFKNEDIRKESLAISKKENLSLLVTGLKIKPTEEIEKRITGASNREEVNLERDAIIKKWLVSQQRKNRILVSLVIVSLVAIGGLVIKLKGWAKLKVWGAYLIKKWRRRSKKKKRKKKVPFIKQ